MNSSKSRKENVSRRFPVGILKNNQKVTNHLYNIHQHNKSFEKQSISQFGSNPRMGGFHSNVFYHHHDDANGIRHGHSSVHKAVHERIQSVDKGVEDGVDHSINRLDDDVRSKSDLDVVAKDSSFSSWRYTIHYTIHYKPNQMLE